ncbi:RNase H [Erysipelatoclostridium sp. An15]|uniref:Ribonuclease H n=1 Tax=Candidatus Erysipelatoclostridium merdavium TaxID=2838566 RepID=A0A9D2BP52_9FIRM|nr:MULTISPECIES: ribonuclease H family protein [unclassified Thomasclavelia]OUQ08677.1 RNase H [Erysipelatoclostridium sp. An15]HIX82647.1 ribonuclease H family protein [Candidatus Erysipelatoclostridium merdavium]
MAKYYAVKKGHKPGIYTSWDECKKQVEKFSGAVYKSFTSLEDAKNFIKLEEEKIVDYGLIAYVDGSYNIKTKEYGFGCILIEGQKVIKELSGKGDKEALVSMRNVAGEILGSLAAMKFALENGYPGVCIYYDYEGIEKWANGLWRANKIGTQNYQKLVNEYRKKINISFIKVLAHSGDFFNERADKLAKKAVGING